MEWNFFTAQNLAVIDREIGVNNFSLAEYEIVRRVIYYTADFEYKSLLNFSQKPIKNGASALVCRSSIIVDVPMVQAGIMTSLAKTFSNPIYCLQDISPSLPPKQKKSWALNNLLKRYPGAICIIGQNQLILTALLELLDYEKIQPSLIIATPPIFLHLDTIKHKFNNSFVPHIRINNCKGGVNVAVAIFNSLVDLAWLAYEEKFNSENFH